jgi:hypothetical protein
MVRAPVDLGGAQVTPAALDVEDDAPDIDPDDPRLDAFVEALACAILEDLTSGGSEQ